MAYRIGSSKHRVFNFLIGAKCKMSPITVSDRCGCRDNTSVKNFKKLRDIGVDIQKEPAIGAEGQKYFIYWIANKAECRKRKFVEENFTDTIYTRRVSREGATIAKRRNPKTDWAI